MANNMNFLYETLETLKEHNLTSEDVIWVGSLDGKRAMSWNSFEKIADIEYHSGWGTEEIYTELVIVGKDWWLERHDYDGSEWWEYKKLPVLQANPQRFYTVLDNDWYDEINQTCPLKDQFEEWKETADTKDLEGLS